MAEDRNLDSGKADWKKDLNATSEASDVHMGLGTLEQGEVLKLRHLNKTHFVLSQNWPTYAFSLLAAGGTDVYVSCSDPDVQSFITTLGLFKHESEEGEGARSFLANEVDYLWVQGDSDYVKDVEERYNVGQLTPSTRVILTSTSQGRRCKDGHVITHRKVGGITSGRWLVKGVTPSTGADDCEKKHRHHTLFRDSVQRTLGHFMKDTVKGGITVGSDRAQSGLSLGAQRTFRSEDRIPFGRSKIPVVSRSVFASSGFVKRYLSLEELFDAYDLQIETAELLSIAQKGSDLFHNHVIHSCPSKVTRRVIEATLCSRVQEERKAGRAEGSEIAPGGRVKWLEFEDPDAALNDEKAARDDDLQADEAQWDNYVIKHFDPKSEWEEMLRTSCVLDKHGEKREWAEKSAEALAAGTSPLICSAGKAVSAAHTKLFNLLRGILLTRNKRNLRKSFSSYCSETYGRNWLVELLDYRRERKLRLFARGVNGKRRRDPGYDLVKLEELEKDVCTGTEAMERYGGSSWWDWTLGSTLHFWRWHPEYRKQARDGDDVWITGRFKPYKKTQTWPKIPEHRTKVKEKILKVVKRGYMAQGPVASLTGFFAVPKGESDIRLVYDATKCGFNDVIWSPSFLLPTIDDTLQQVDIGGWMGDIDLGEMFLNFPLDETARKYVGLDLTALKDEESFKQLVGDMSKNKRVFLRWTRCLMGLRCSPYLCVKAFAWAEEFIKGDIKDPNNPFFYDTISLNVPGAPDYDPSRPTVQRRVGRTGDLCGNFEVYIDDIRVCGPSLRACVKVARRIASRCNYLGIQDAARKRRFPSRNPGVWSGAKAISTGEGLYTSTTLAKWEKGRAIVNGWMEEMETGDGYLDRKGMEKGRGFLVHLARTYPIFTPYLKGVHHTLESWRSGRDDDGWKYSGTEWRRFLTEVGEMKDGTAWEEVRKAYIARRDQEAPSRVDGFKVGRLRDDLKVLAGYFKYPLPPRRLVRGKGVMVVKYGFGDASGTGFGASWEEGDGIRYRFGVWGKDNEGRSSNYRELRNIVETFEAMNHHNSLNGKEIFFFTDNSTAERAFYKGSSTSRTLHDLVARLRELELSSGVKIMLCHVSGKRMIRQGSDGLSRGNLEEGVMGGATMGSFVPLHQNALERSSNLLGWLESWVGSGSFEVLDVDGWFGRGHDHSGDGFENIDRMWMTGYRSGTYVWAPPPGAALIAAQQLRRARLKRTKSCHVFVCPRLMEPVWRSQIHKSADLIFEIPPCQPWWDCTMFEPLIIAVYFPYLRNKPWCFKGTKACLGVEEHMRDLFKRGSESTGSVLRQLWSQARRLEDLSESVVCKMLHSDSGFDLSCS